MATTLAQTGIQFPDGTTQTTTYTRQVYSGVLSGAGLYTSPGKYYVWNILYNGSQARELPSPDEFLVRTTVNDFYGTNSGSTNNWNRFTYEKSVRIQNPFGSISPAQSQFLYRLFSDQIYPYPNNLNFTIFVHPTSTITSLTFTQYGL